MRRVLLQRLFKTFQDLCFCLPAVVIFQRLPSVGLRVLQKAKQQLGVEGMGNVIVGRAVAFDVSLITSQAGDDMRFEDLLVVNVGGAVVARARLGLANRCSKITCASSID